MYFECMYVNSIYEPCFRLVIESEAFFLVYTIQLHENTLKNIVVAAVIAHGSNWMLRKSNADNVRCLVLHNFFSWQ